MEQPPSNAARPAITVVGSVNMDMVVGVPRHPAPGETIIGSDYVTHPGGKGANQAVAAARLGGDVRFVGRVGADGFGVRLRDSLTGSGVDTGYLGVSAAPSGVAFIQVDGRGQNSIVVSPGANFALTPADLADTAFDGAAAVLLQLEVPLQVTLAAARKARRSGAHVILNLAPAQRLSAPQLSDVTHLCVNEHEASLLLDAPVRAVTSDARGAAQRLCDLVPHVVITLGRRGAAWAARRQEGVSTGEVPAFPVEVVDTTAAGDAFTGALALFLARGGGAADLSGAVRFASAAGALATTKPGAQPSLPRLAEVEKLLAGTPS